MVNETFCFGCPQAYNGVVMVGPLYLPERMSTVCKATRPSGCMELAREGTWAGENYADCQRFVAFSQGLLWSDIAKINPNQPVL